jgi:hypothetical protein
MPPSNRGGKFRRRRIFPTGGGANRLIKSFLAVFLFTGVPLCVP